MEGLSPEHVLDLGADGRLHVLFGGTRVIQHIPPQRAAAGLKREPFPTFQPRIPKFPAQNSWEIPTEGGGSNLSNCCPEIPRSSCGIPLGSSREFPAGFLWHSLRNFPRDFFGIPSGISCGISLGFPREFLQHFLRDFFRNFRGDFLRICWEFPG